MITIEKIQSYSKEELPAIAEKLDADEICQLVTWLDEKDDTIRYPSFLLLQHRSSNRDDVYPYWDTLRAKFNSPNSFQRSLGLMLIADNVRWDRENKFNGLVDTYLTFCDDEKPITVRQCIQSLVKIVPFKPQAIEKITQKLMSIDIAVRKETQRKILLMDILTVLATINKIQPQEKINQYIHHAMLGGLLDKKAKNEIEKLL